MKIKKYSRFSNLLTISHIATLRHRAGNFEIVRINSSFVESKILCNLIITLQSKRKRVRIFKMPFLKGIFEGFLSSEISFTFFFGKVRFASPANYWQFSQTVLEFSTVARFSFATLAWNFITHPLKFCERRNIIFIVYFY